MNAARAYRRLREFEEQKLANRLALLKAEIAKAAKRIEETQDATLRLQSIQDELKAKNEAKIEEIRAKQKEELYQTGLNAILREKSNLVRLQQLEKQRAERAAEAKRRAEERKRAEEEVEREEAQQCLKAELVKTSIRQQEIQARQARKAEEKARRAAAQEQFKQRLIEQEEKTRAAEHHLMTMQSEESKLIELLKFTRENQEKAAQRLQQVRAQNNQCIKANNKQMIKAQREMEQEKFKLSKEILKTVHQQAVKQILQSPRKLPAIANSSRAEASHSPSRRRTASPSKFPPIEAKEESKEQTPAQVVEAGE